MNTIETVPIDRAPLAAGIVSPVYSIVAPVFNEAETLPHFYQRVVDVLLIGGVRLIFLGIIGEYLGRIYDEVRARPLYVVRQVLDSGDPARL